MQQQAIYLDHAAATPMDPRVAASMEPYLTEKFYNPSATYLAAKAVAQDLGQARADISKWLGARPSEVTFTAGGTEANNLAVHGVMNAYPGANIVISGVEHDSVIKPAEVYGHEMAQTLPSGLVDQKSLIRLINDQTVLISVIYANNEIGTIQPLRQISLELDAIRNDRQRRGLDLPLYFHTDACQAGAYLDLHASRLGVDMMTLNGGKIYGPKQSGILYVKTGVRLKPVILGGGQENGLRSGTENVASSIGLAKALDIVQARKKDENNRLQELQKQFTQEVSSKINGVTINGTLKTRLPNNVHLAIAGQDNEWLMMTLDERGIQCAVGSACSASSDEPSHVLKAIGLSNEQARSSLRFTMGRQTTLADVQKVVKVLAEITS